MTTKINVLVLVLISTTAQANFFKEFDNHFKHVWQNFEQDIQSATKSGSLSINSSYDADNNAVIVKVTIPGLTEKDINFNLEDHKLVLDAKHEGRESLVVITDRSILVEQTEYDEYTNKKGKVITINTGHNHVMNSLPRTVLLHEASAEYENNTLTITLPSSAKKMAIPVTYKGNTQVTVNTETVAPVEEKKEKKQIIVKSKKKQTGATPTEEDAK